MSRVLWWFRREIGSQTSSPVSGAWQYVVHLLVVYGGARYCMPWLAWQLHDHVFPALLHQRPTISTLQFFFSNLLGFSVVCGLLAGFLNSRFLLHPAVRFVWALPFVILVVAFLFKAPGMYPTMIFQSDFGTAFHYAFGGGFKIPRDFHTRRELWRAFAENPDMKRGYFQFQYAVPAYTAIAYSFGALLSFRLTNVRSPEPTTAEVIR